MEKLGRVADPLIKTLAARLLLKSGSLKNSMGSEGGVSLRIRNNIAMEAQLKKRVSTNTTAISKLNIGEIREKTLSFTEQMRLKSRPYGQYRYSPSGRSPLLYASVYACLLRDLYNDMSQLSFSERQDWIRSMQNHQHDDGLFKDAAVANQLAETADWWGWRHLTLHTVMALDALGVIAPKRISFLREFKNREVIVKWLNSRDWNGNVANVSNEIQNYCALLQYARDFHDESWAEDALNIFYDELDKRQNTRTGSWGNKIGNSGLLSITVQTGYHIWILYFYDKKQVRFADKIVDSCLGTQNRLGGFSPFLNSSACEDIDSIDPLVRLYHLDSYRRAEIKTACKRAMIWIMTNMNRDGGFVFRRNEPFLYGHENMFSGINESETFSTWFRSLSLAYVSKILHESAIGRFNWHFLQCPGYQFWR